MSKLRVAVIGCGRILAAYSPAFKKIEEEGGIELVLAFDKALKRAQNFAAAFPGCAASAEVEEWKFRAVLKKYRPDILHILLPHHLHCRYAVAALEEGVHVLTEKPIGISLEEADEMIAAQKRSGKQLGVIFQNRYIDGVCRVRELIESGAMGAVKGAFSTLNWFRPASYYECDWKGSWATEGGGVIIDQAIHSIDLVRYMTGLEAVKVQGHTSRRVLKTIEVEDEADAAVTLSNGAVYSFFACNYYTTNSPIRVEICCENATAQLTFDEMEIRWTDGRREVVRSSAGVRNASGESYWGAFHEMQIRESYQAVREGTVMPWTPQDARRTLEIVLGIYLSARIQDDVTFPLG